MASQESLDVARRAKLLYEQRLRVPLEAQHRHSFVAIEPDSEDYFLGDSLSAAIQLARQTHPDRLAFVMRIGHHTAIHMGVLSA